MAVDSHELKGSSEELVKLRPSLNHAAKAETYQIEPVGKRVDHADGLLRRQANFEFIICDRGICTIARI